MGRFRHEPEVLEMQAADTANETLLATFNGAYDHALAGLDFVAREGLHSIIAQGAYQDVRRILGENGLLAGKKMGEVMIVSTQAVEERGWRRLTVGAAAAGLVMGALAAVGIVSYANAHSSLGAAQRIIQTEAVHEAAIAIKQANPSTDPSRRFMRHSVPGHPDEIELIRVHRLGDGEWEKAVVVLGNSGFGLNGDNVVSVTASDGENGHLAIAVMVLASPQAEVASGQFPNKPAQWAAWMIDAGGTDSEGFRVDTAVPESYPYGPPGGYPSNSAERVGMARQISQMVRREFTCAASDRNSDCYTTG